MLLDKLNSISKPKLNKLSEGSADTIKDFWDEFIEPNLPEKETVLKWHRLLMNYIKQPEAMFAIRGFNNAPPDRYDDLRRGFLSITSEGYSFFYTDNFHAAYYLKMVKDNYVPELNDLLSTYINRKFPARFGRDTSNERVFMAFPKGKDPGIQTSGYKIAHIINVGKDYFWGSENLSLSEILDRHFPKGKRSDWILTSDETGTHYIREHIVNQEAKKYLIAEFLRFVHPFNYFLAPKKNLSISTVSKDISEYKPLIDYVQCKFREIYGEEYQEYLDLIMVNEDAFNVVSDDEFIGLKYGFSVHEANNNELIANNQIKKKASAKKGKNSEIHKIHDNYKKVYSKETEKDMVIEYLTNPDTSFRKLEEKYLGIKSKARGGGFVAKKIINSYGVSAQQKGIYTKDDISDKFSN